MLVPNTKIYTGIDASLNNWGLVLVTHTEDTLSVNYFNLATLPKEEVITSPKNLSDLEKAKRIYKVTKSYLETCDEVFIELPTGSKSARAMASYGICIGLTAGLDFNPLTVIKPRESKKLVVGTSEASKSEVIDWVLAKHPELTLEKNYVRLLGSNCKLPLGKFEHIADAIIAIHCGLKLRKIKDASTTKP